MRSFKVHLNEDSTASTFQRSSWSLLQRSGEWIPLTNKISNIINDGKTKRILALHTSNLDGAYGLIKLQGKRNQISVTTDRSKPFYGVVSQNSGVIAVVYGDVKFSHWDDAWSEVDRGGTRWIKIKKDFASNEQLEDEYNKINAKLYLFKTELMKQYEEKTGTITMNKDQVKKVKENYIEAYVRFCERFIAPELQKISDARAKDYFENIGEGSEGYDEIVMSNIKIKSFYLSPYNVSNLRYLGLGDRISEQKLILKKFAEHVKQNNIEYVRVILGEEGATSIALKRQVRKYNQSVGFK